MSRRGRSGPSVSLFAFQDIITSVTAILIVIVLLLVLDLVQRKESRNHPVDQIATDLKSRLETLQAEIDRLQAQADSSTTAVQQVSTVTEASLATDIDALRANIEKVTRAIEKSKERLTEIEPQLQANRALITATEHLKREAEELTGQSSKIQAEIEELKEQNRTIFTAPRGFSGNGWVMVIEAERIQVAPMGRAMVPVTFSGTEEKLLGNRLSQQFIDWNKNQKPSIGYWLLLIRPDGTEVFDALQDELDRQNANYGFDLVDSQQMIIHPERGAAY